MSKLEQITAALAARQPRCELVRASACGKTVIVLAVVGEVRDADTDASVYEVWSWSPTVAGGPYHGAVGLTEVAADALYESWKGQKT